MGLRGRLIVAGLGALIVALTLVGWGASQQANYGREAEDQAAENARHADYDIRYRCVPLPPLHERNCVIDTRREQRDYQRHEQELYAQKTSAFWTFLIGSAAVVGMLLSAVGVFLVFFTFGETRRANILNMHENVRATRRALASASQTAAAVAAANRSADAAHDANRPWLELELFHAEPLIFDGNGAHLGLGIKIRNRGSSPATHMLVVSRLIPVPIGEAIDTSPKKSID